MKISKESKKIYFTLLGLFIAFRIYLMFNVGFFDDEAYHWSWAKNLHISYFDHPGMVAWIIWPFIKIFGDQAWAIRIPSLLIFLSIVYFVYKLARELFDERVAQISSLLLCVIPLWGFASLGTVPDVPLGLFWIMIAWIFWQSIKKEKPWSTMKTWLWIGFVMGLGMNSKLTICLTGLGMGLFLLLSPKHRRQLKTPWPYVGAFITFVMMTPVFIWNSEHNWASFDYQFYRRHLEDHGINFLRWLQFWGYQWVFMSPMVYIMIVAAFAYGIYKIKDDTWRFLFSFTAPALALFYYQPLMSAYKPHWSGPSYMILLIGAVKLFVDGISIGRKKILKPYSQVVISLAAVTLLPFQLLYIPLLTPIIPQIHSVLSPHQKWDPTWDFSNEFYGWKELGDHVKTLQTEYQEVTGIKPNLAAQRYEIIAQLTWGTGWGAPNDEKIWQLSNDRDQFFYDQPLAEKMKLIGQDFLVVNNDKYPGDPQQSAIFEKCEKSELLFYRKDILARTFYVYYCKNFKGLR